MGLAPKMSPNRPRGQILRRFPEPSAKRPPWPKIKGAFWARHLGSRAGIPALICLPRAVLAAPQHGTHCPQAPWPEEQSWLKRKTFSALPRKSCRLNRVVTHSFQRAPPAPRGRTRLVARCEPQPRVGRFSFGREDMGVTKRDSQNLIKSLKVGARLLKV
jgi:hypothetical protein